MKNSQELANHLRLLEATELMEQSYTRWIEQWRLITDKLLTVASTEECTPELLQANQSIIQVMNSLHLIRLEMTTNWSIIQSGFDNRISQKDIDVSLSPKVNLQLEEAFHELTASVIALQVKLLKTCTNAVQYGKAIIVYKQVRRCLELLGRWYVLIETPQRSQYHSYDKLRTTANSSRLHNTNTLIRDFLRAIADIVNRDLRMDQEQRQSLIACVQRIEFNFIQPELMSSSTKGSATHERTTSTPTVPLHKAKPLGKPWIKKGLELKK